MFEYAFMQYAFIASLFISILCGVMGVFVVARRTAFFTHTLSEISFSGAAFGVFMGISPISGMILFTITSALFVGVSGNQISRRESSISVFSAIFIGLGILFLSLSDKQSSYATNILFGSIVGIDIHGLHELIALSIVILVVVALIYRKLKYTTFDGVGAQYNSMINMYVSILFLVLVACTVSVTAQVVGSLLIFALLTIPASAAKYLAKTVVGMMILTFIFALIGTWLGLYLSYLTNWPVSFFITAIEGVIYTLALTWNKVDN